MNYPPRPTSWSRQSTPKKRETNSSLNSLLSDINYERRSTEKLENRVKELEKSSNSFVARSSTPINTKTVEQRINLDLNQVSKGTVMYNYRPQSVIDPRSTTKSITERKGPTPIRISPSPYRITPTPDMYDISYNERNIEYLRNELQQRREMIVGLSDTVSRKQLEHKYWALVTEIEETSSRINEIMNYNGRLRTEIQQLRSNY
ncbi:hypothetical protein SteCoe_7125 [Stentor coeruleus]|uniref:Uncharacterized protein n=1 Tax=Stentor coeruleus TaxID=5963 RepID=A0A1R2CNJ3_9CILI|nr:hypothetical protein SteCoe_7125 [Stentor coeruleus]